MKRTLKTLTVAGVVAVTAGAGVVYFGVIHVGADDPHSEPVYSLLSTARDRSIAVRSRDIEVPDLSDESLIVQVLATTTRCALAATLLRDSQEPS